MGVYIKGLKMPKSCFECKLDLRTDICQAFCEWNAEHPYSIRGKDRLPDCPLVEVPEPHGRLIDADAIEYTHAIARSLDDGHNWNELCVTADEIADMPTIEPEPCEDASCPYCHEDSDGYVTPLEKNCHAFIRFGMNGWCLNLQANKWHGEVKINHCPMCGRKF